jgi:hypothetical protein
MSQEEAGPSSEGELVISLESFRSWRLLEEISLRLCLLCFLSGTQDSPFSLLP